MTPMLKRFLFGVTAALSLAYAGLASAQDTTTTNIGLTQIEVGASDDTWGEKLNTNAELIDDIFAAAGTGTSVGLNVGSGKTLSVAGTLTVTGTANLDGPVSATGATVTYTNATPQLRFAESDQTDPAGRWRFHINGDNFNFQRSATASWATFGDVFNVTGSTRVVDFAVAPTVNGGAITLADPLLASIAGLTFGSDNYIYGTGSDAAAVGTITSYGRSLVDDADATTARSTLGVVIGTNVQAYDADLTTWGAKAIPSGVVVGDTDTQTLSNKTLTTPVLGVATATSINKVAITAPATSATLTLANGSTLATSGAFSQTFTATATTAVTLPTTGTLATRAGTETFTNKTLTSPAINTATISGGTINNAAIGGSTPAAGAFTTLSSSGAAALSSLTLTTDLAVAQGGTGASDASTARSNLGVTIGSEVQGYDPDLGAIASLSSNGILTRTASETWAVRSIVGSTGLVVTNADGISGNPTLTLDSDLGAIAGVTSAADKVPYFTGSGTATVATMTSAARDLLDDTDAAAMRATLGVTGGTGSDYVPSAVAITGGTIAGVSSIAATSSADGPELLTLTGTNAGTNGPTLALFHNSASPANSDTVGRLQFNGKSFGSTVTVGQIRVSFNDASPTATDGTIGIATIQNDFLTEVANFRQGFYVGAPTGFDMGSGTINATTLYQDGTALASLFQGLDADLTSIAALTTTSFGRGVLDDADAAALRTTAGLGTSATVNTGTSGATIPLLNGTNTWASAQTFTAAPVFTDASGSRSALGLGTSATVNTGTSGATIPLLNAANTHSGNLLVTGQFGIGTASTYTIASGVITITNSHVKVDTEASAGTDDLDTINGGIDGQIVVLSGFSNTRDVTVKDNVGNIQLASDFAMLTNAYRLTLSYFNGTWYELSRSAN